MAELERQLEALRAGGNSAASLSQAPDAGAAAPVAAAADPSESRVEAKYAQLLSSLQDEWEREKGRLQRELAAEKDRANEAVHKAAAERKRLTDALQERISSLTKQVSGDMTGLGKRCGRGPPPQGDCVLWAQRPAPSLARGNCLCTQPLTWTWDRPCGVPCACPAPVLPQGHRVGG